MKKVERNEYGKKVNANDRVFKLYLKNCPPEPVSEFVNALDACKFNDKWRRVLEPEKEYYHYHPDHLGSSSWITDQRGTPVQHIQYLPFGETWADQRSANWNAPYTFSGKEKDWETSYHYYGARYYDSDLSIWLSVDPLAHLYPSLSPYAYCGNNPVRYWDPDGRAFGDPPKRPILKGIVTTAGGIVSTVVGVGLCVVPTGASQIAGAGLIVTGIPSIGLGIAQIYDGVKNNGQSNIPGGVIEAVGQGVDYATKNENGSFAKGGEFLDAISGGKPQGAADAIVTGTKLLMMGMEGNDSQQPTNSSTNTTTGQQNGTENTNQQQNSTEKINNDQKDNQKPFLDKKMYIKNWFE